MHKFLKTVDKLTIEIAHTIKSSSIIKKQLQNGGDDSDLFTTPKSKDKSKRTPRTSRTTSKMYNSPITQRKIQSIIELYDTNGNDLKITPYFKNKGEYDINEWFIRERRGE